MKEKYYFSIAYHTPSSPSIPWHNHSSHHTPFTYHLHKPPSALYISSKLPLPKHPSSPPLGLVGTAPYHAVTSGTAIEHPHPAEPWMPSYLLIIGSRVREILSHIHAQVLLCIHHECHQRRELPP